MNTHRCGEAQARGAMPIALLGVLSAFLAFGTPARAADVPPRRLLEVVDFGLPVLSPDGSRVAFRTEQASVERNTYDTVWYVQEMDSPGAPRRVADGGAALRDSAGGSLPAAAVWSSDGQWIHYLAQVDGRIDVWRAAADGSGAEPLTREAADVREFLLGDDGRSVIYRTGATRAQVIDAEEDEYDRGIRIERQVPIGPNLFRSLNLEGRWATQRYHHIWFDFEPLLADAPQRWKVLDPSSGATRDLAASRLPSRSLDVDLADGLRRPWKLAEEPGGGRIALLTRVGNAAGLLEAPDVQLAMLADRTDRRPMVCAAERCTGKAISGILWRPGTDEVLFTVTDPAKGLAQSIFRWNVRTHEVLPVVEADGLLGGGRDRSSACGVSGAALACVAADADRPPRLERVDLETGARQVLFDPNASLASDMARGATARLLRWTDANGNAFTGQFFEAQGMDGAPAPLFVTYYSCSGFLRGGVGDEWPLASLAGHGISALCITAPPGYPLDAMERYDRGLSAVRTVVELLAAERKIDRSKVGMGGLSFGSEVTFWTAMRSDLLAAASITSPSIEPNYHLFNALRDDAFFENLRALWGLGAPDETPERWRDISPIHHVDRIRTPMLFQMPEQEYLGSLGVTLPLVRRSQGDLYVFPHEAHQKFQPRHKLAAYERNLDWFRFWLLGEEDSHPAKAEQYAHWRGMRAALAERAGSVPQESP
ncbi:Atxe2 family lasso peptide isopeptidase [Luteimonas granuli]|uniref:Atxe2 family lasso peptide isopeptidase n=1 Tax=Luteimonas granuli TaxID=1176533 RepID=A0A518N6M3_9GAMM|nr:Atxe2 family lasso peptide isopeptidase [Luteimonas granuli]QDW67575.1 Atxe2 family lasso peptide isopeptidase [Luteimonas granuli]